MNDNVAAVAVVPGVTVRFALLLVELVRISDGLQSAFPLRDATASTVYPTGPLAGGAGVWAPLVLNIPTLGLAAGTASV